PEPFVRWREAAREHAMRNDEGAQVFRRVLAAGLPQVAISTRSIPARIAELAEVVERAAATMVSAPVPGGARTARPELGAAYVAPEGDDELVIARLWEELLGVEPVGRHDDFFALGGHSLLAIQLLTKLRARFGVSASLRQLFDAPTVAGVAALVGAEARGEGDDGETAQDFDLPVRRVTLGNGLEINHVSPAETAHFYRDIFEHRGYLSHGLALPAGATVFDVGGNIGMFTLFVHCEAPDARIFTFEPAPPLFRVLSRNVGEHGVRAKLFNCGVSDHEGRASFTFYPYSSGMSSIHADHQEEREVLAAIFHNQAQLGIGDRRALDQAGAGTDPRLDEQAVDAVVVGVGVEDHAGGAGPKGRGRAQQLAAVDLEGVVALAPLGADPAPGVGSPEVVPAEVPAGQRQLDEVLVALVDGEVRRGDEATDEGRALEVGQQGAMERVLDQG
ncbi:MAG: FkbM family methyltransferase, partial [Myxococcales bacterium]|nr:FkbM family methyltransferase [Myxococcales bacterium]